jgi:hypothetical protein
VPILLEEGNEEANRDDMHIWNYMSGAMDNDRSFIERRLRPGLQFMQLLHDLSMFYMIYSPFEINFSELLNDSYL